MCVANRKISGIFSKDNVFNLDPVRPAETERKYIAIAQDRIQQAMAGTLRTRPMNKPKYDPALNNNRLALSPLPGASAP